MTKGAKSRVVTPEQFSKTTLASFKQVSAFAMGGSADQPSELVEKMAEKAEKLFEVYGQALFVVPTMVLNAKNSIAENEDMDFTSTMKGVAFYGLVICVTVVAVCLSTAKHAFAPPDNSEEEEQE